MYRAPPQSEGMRNPQIQTSQLTTVAANTTGPSMVPQAAFRYSGSALHLGGFQREIQAHHMPQFGHSFSIEGWTALKPYGMATPIFLGRLPTHQGFTASVPPSIPYPAGPAPPHLIQDALANMIESMYGPHL